MNVKKIVMSIFRFNILREKNIVRINNELSHHNLELFLCGLGKMLNIDDWAVQTWES